jgi:hypothetical protein
MPRRSGRHFLQIPGPTNVPERVLHAIAEQTIDHRGPDFATLARRVLGRLGIVFQTQEPVIVYPSSGTGASEAALVNTLSPGDAVLMYETGHFARLWAQMARRLGLEVERLEGDWRTGVDVERIRQALAGAPPPRRGRGGRGGGRGGGGGGPAAGPPPPPGGPPPRPHDPAAALSAYADAGLDHLVARVVTVGDDPVATVHQVVRALAA